MPPIRPVSLLPWDLTCHQQFQGITAVGPDIWPPASPPVAALVTASLGWGHLLQEELRQFLGYIPVNHSSELCRLEECKPPGGLGCLAPQGDIDPRGHNCSGLSAQPRPGAGGWGAWVNVAAWVLGLPRSPRRRASSWSRRRSCLRITAPFSASDPRS